MKELDLTPHEGDLEAVAILLDCLEMTKVKTKYQPKAKYLIFTEF